MHYAVEDADNYSGQFDLDQLRKKELSEKKFKLPLKSDANYQGEPGESGPV